VNKADRPGADDFANSLQKVVNQYRKSIPVIKTIASSNRGIKELAKVMLNSRISNQAIKESIITDRAWKIIQQKRMQDIDKVKLKSDIKKFCHEKDFNLYRFLNEWL